MAMIRRAAERGHANFGWLNSFHSFSFGEYYDARHMGWSVLRVINDDTVAPGSGFGAHPHRDMEIISYVLQGQIRHQDSMGNVSILKAGEVQRMSAGTGVMHSEYNAGHEPLKFLQIWILPSRRGIEPGYEQQTVEVTGALTPLVTADGRDNSLRLHQDVGIHRLQLAAGESFSFDSGKRRGYLHLIQGELQAAIRSRGSEGSDLLLGAGDAVGLESAEQLQLQARGDVHALWFDLP